MSSHADLRILTLGFPVSYVPHKTTGRRFLFSSIETPERRIAGQSIHLCRKKGGGKKPGLSTRRNWKFRGQYTYLRNDGFASCKTSETRIISIWINRYTVPKLPILHSLCLTGKKMADGGDVQISVKRPIKQESIHARSIFRH